MRVADLNWMQMERLLEREDRAVLPLGSTEQHAYLSLTTDDILAERVAVDAAEPLGVPVFPVLNYGITPDFMAYPGTVTLGAETFVAVVTDVLRSIAAHGFKRVLIVNGHGGNARATGSILNWAAGHATSGRPFAVRWHDWWAAPRVMARVKSIDPDASHASWMENFPWTRLPVRMPDERKGMIDHAHYKTLDPAGVRAYLGDGSFGGPYVRSDDEMHAVWREAVAETRAQIDEGWG